MKKVNKHHAAADNEISESTENLGLDADHSSDGPSMSSRLNDDNDRITGNQHGENDERAEDDYTINTPLDEK